MAEGHPPDDRTLAHDPEHRAAARLAAEEPVDEADTSPAGPRPRGRHEKEANA